jgi:2-dehydro-3-deoxyphosphooctonate aldolase (KDO 8-P synthase)
VRDSGTALWKQLSSGKQLVLIAGPCVIESEELCREVAVAMGKLCRKLDVAYVFKASFDKANRTSGKSFRGPGIESGLAVLADIRARFGLPVLTDVHTEDQARLAADAGVDILQIPAFLCRQTDLIHAAVETGKIVNIKKGQFLSPQEMNQVVKKAREVGDGKLLVTERGTTFGYNNLVSDMRSIPILSAMGYPVIFDATHSVQQPGGGGDKSSGQREFAPVLARCAIAAGADGVFIETHPNPDKALSDGPNMVPLADMPALIKTLLHVREAVR